MTAIDAEGRETNYYGIINKILEFHCEAKMKTNKEKS
jgi:hypothetical protein